METIDPVGPSRRIPRKERMLIQRRASRGRLDLFQKNLAVLSTYHHRKLELLRCAFRREAAISASSLCAGIAANLAGHPLAGAALLGAFTAGTLINGGAYLKNSARLTKELNRRLLPP